MVKDPMSHLRTRMAAAVLGATVAMAGMGAAGALNAPIQFVSSFGEETDECATTTPDEDAEAEVEVPDAPQCDDGAKDETEDGKDTGAVDPGAGPAAPESTGLPDAPTAVREAAHIHDFDEACGNHGSYVSHVARFGDEPECAADVRTGAAGPDGDDAAQADVEGEAGDEHDDDAEDEDDAGDDEPGKRHDAESGRGHGPSKG